MSNGEWLRGDQWTKEELAEMVEGYQHILNEKYEGWDGPPSFDLEALKRIAVEELKARLRKEIEAAPVAMASGSVSVQENIKEFARWKLAQLSYEDFEAYHHLRYRPEGSICSIVDFYKIYGGKALQTEDKGREMTKEAKVECPMPHKAQRWVGWDARHDARCSACNAVMRYTGEMRLVEVMAF